MPRFDRFFCERNISYFGQTLESLLSLSLSFPLSGYGPTRPLALSRTAYCFIKLRLPVQVIVDKYD